MERCIEISPLSVEEALKRFELGVEDYEIVEEDSSPPEADCFPLPSKKVKVKQKVRHTRDLNLTLEKKDFGQKKVVHSTKRKVVSTLLQCEMCNFRVVRLVRLVSS